MKLAIATGLAGHPYKALRRHSLKPQQGPQGQKCREQGLAKVTPQLALSVHRQTGNNIRGHQPLHPLLSL